MKVKGHKENGIFHPHKKQNGIKIIRNASVEGTPVSHAPDFWDYRRKRKEVIRIFKREYPDQAKGFKSETYDVLGGESPNWRSKLTTNTSQQGNIKTSYDDLVKNFGEPTKTYDFSSSPRNFHNKLFKEKVQVEWVIVFKNPDQVATIYDWKSDINPKNQNLWNIGGDSDNVLGRIGDVIGHEKTTDSDSFDFGHGFE